VWSVFARLVPGYKLEFLVKPLYRAARRTSDVYA